MDPSNRSFNSIFSRWLPGHSCYLVESTNGPFSPLPRLSAASQVSNSYPSLLALCPPDPMLRLRSGNRVVDLPKSLLCFGEMISCQVMAFLHSATCACKCKTFLIPNRPLSVDNLIYLDLWGTTYGRSMMCQVCGAMFAHVGDYCSSTLKPRDLDGTRWQKERSGSFFCSGAALIMTMVTVRPCASNAKLKKKG